MEKGTIIILTEKLGYGCKTVHPNTIGQVVEILDPTHVKISFCADESETRNSNHNRFYVDKSQESLNAYLKSTSYKYATID